MEEAEQNRRCICSVVARNLARSENGKTSCTSLVVHRKDLDNRLRPPSPTFDAPSSSPAPIGSSSSVLSSLPGCLRLRLRCCLLKRTMSSQMSHFKTCTKTWKMQNTRKTVQRNLSILHACYTTERSHPLSPIQRFIIITPLLAAPHSARLAPSSIPILI
jgi:hypothetical protein